MKKIIALLVVAGIVISTPAIAFAHVVVKPAQIGVGSFQTFTTGVPNEKKVAVTGLRLVIPAGLNYVQPNVKPGWTIDEKTTGGGDFPTVTEISWTGGSIPAGQRDDFQFSAQVPAKASVLAWKAYQTYEDGTVVSWDQKPNGKDNENSTPYSETKVVNDLGSATSTSNTMMHNDMGSNNSTMVNLSLALGLLGTVLGAAALLFNGKKK